MSFVFPLGLLGLIGVPILIIIYIIKSRYTEQMIPSNYIWNLSEKFLKKKKRRKRLTGLIALILQILTVVIISLTIAHPIIVIPESANDYCFILDGSGSMQIKNGNKTRLQLGKEEIKELINDSLKGSTYSLIYIGDTTSVLFSKEDDKEVACNLIDDIECSYLSTTCVDSLGFAQDYFDKNPSIKTYLVSDKDYNSNNINVINVSDDSLNYSVYDVDYIEKLNVEANTAYVTVTGKLMSNISDESLNVELYFDKGLAHSESINVVAGEETEFTFETTKEKFSTIEVRINNTDSLASDNQAFVYNVLEEHEYNTVIVSETGFYIESAIKASGTTDVILITPEEYETGAYTGYGLYVFESYNPSVLPGDGAVWFFNLGSNLSDTGFSYQDIITLEDADVLTYSSNKTTTFKTLTQGVFSNEIYIVDYIKYKLNRSYTSILEYDGNPVVFATTTTSGNREIVFAFDLLESNFAITPDFNILLNNLLNYSFPTILDDSTYTCGDTLNVNVLSNCSSIRVESPSGMVTYLNVNTDIAEYLLTDVGTYKVTVMLSSKDINGNEKLEEKVFSIYAQFPEDERVELDVLEDAFISGEAENEYSDAIYDELIIFFIVLAVIFMADWVVYCIEQHQLR
ncbi:MAG: VWA domain-containing protein [Acholeplasmatales bacterium]|nr:VWA domain-containing protein [Acholeplasmatales bacterium]